jgi:hypothetical protein
MTRGYLVMAQGNYTHLAEHLARSIWSTQSEIKNISVITDGDCNKQLFDQVIAVPDQDLAKDSDWKIHNRCRFYDLSPYDETVILDADMLFLTDVSYWWNSMSRYELLLTNKVMTYRNHLVQDNYYRKTFQDNNLPNVYSAFVYFKKTPLVETFFDLTKSIITNWDTWTLKYTPNSRQTFPSMDVAAAIAIKILGIEHEVTSCRNYPTFTHMKSHCQGWRRSTSDWQSTLPVYATSDNIRLGSFLQSGILHYVNKDFVDNKILSIFK